MCETASLSCQVLRPVRMLARQGLHLGFDVKAFLNSTPSRAMRSKLRRLDPGAAVGAGVRAAVPVVEDDEEDVGAGVLGGGEELALEIAIAIAATRNVLDRTRKDFITSLRNR